MKNSGRLLPAKPNTNLKSRTLLITYPPRVASSSSHSHLFFLSRKSATARSKSAMPVESNTVMSVSLLRPAAFPRMRSPSSPQIRSSDNVPCFKGISISPAFLQCSRSSTKTMASSKIWESISSLPAISAPMQEKCVPGLTHSFESAGCGKA